MNKNINIKTIRFTCIFQKICFFIFFILVFIKNSCAVEHGQDLSGLSETVRHMDRQIRALEPRGSIESVMTSIELLKRMMGGAAQTDSLKRCLQYLLSVLGADEANGILDIIQRCQEQIGGEGSLTARCDTLVTLLDADQPAISFLTSVTQDMGVTALNTGWIRLRRMVGGAPDKTILINLEQILDYLGGRGASIMERLLSISGGPREETMEAYIQLLKTRSEESDVLRENVRALSATVEELTKTKTDLEGQVHPRQAEITRLTTEKRALAQHVIDLNADTEQLRIHMQDLSDQIARLRAQHEALNIEKAELETENTTLWEEKRRFAAQNLDLTAAKDSLTARAQTLEHDLDAAENKVTELGAERITLSERMSLILKEKQDLEVDVHRLTIELRSLEAQREPLKVAKLLLDNQIKDLREDCQYLQEQLDKTSATVESCHSRIQDLMSEKISLQTQISTLSATQEKMALVQQDMGEDLTALAEQNAALQAERADLRSQLGHLGTENKTLSDQVATLSTDKDTLTARIASVSTMVGGTGTVEDQVTVCQGKIGQGASLEEGLQMTLFSLGSATLASAHESLRGATGLTGPLAPDLSTLVCRIIFLLNNGVRVKEKDLNEVTNLSQLCDYLVARANKKTLLELGIVVA